MNCAEQLEHFSLRWNNFNDNMKTGFHDLLRREDFVDVTIAVEGKLIQAHKMVLSICSPYFRNIFKANPCQHPIVFLKDVTHRELAGILQFMYLGEVSVQQEELARFLKTAEALQVKGLTNEDGKDKEDAASSSSKHKTFREDRQQPRFIGSSNSGGSNNSGNRFRTNTEYDYNVRNEYERMNINQETNGFNRVSSQVMRQEMPEQGTMNHDGGGGGGESEVLVKNEPPEIDFYDIEYDEMNMKDDAASYNNNNNNNSSHMQDNGAESFHNAVESQSQDLPNPGNYSGTGNDRCYKLKMIADELAGSEYDGYNFSPVLTKNQGLCPICGRILQHKKNLQTHITDQHSGVLKCWSCRICNKVCKTWSALRVHTSRHHAKLDAGPGTMAHVPNMTQRIQ